MINRIYMPATLSLNIDGTIHLKGESSWHINTVNHNYSAAQPKNTYSP